MTRFTDRATFDGALTKTADGWVAQARVARGGNVQVYLGSEMGLMDRQTVRVYRPPEEVFDRAAFATYARKPITLGHPEGGVTAETWKDLAVGEIDRDVVRDGEFVSVPLLFRDAAAVAAMQAPGGPRELSMGYDANVELKDGITPQGEAYDAVMAGFRMNHVAVVPLARGGSELRIGDSAGNWGAAPITTSDHKEVKMTDALKTVVLGDQAVQVAASDAPAIEKFKADAAKAIADASSEHAKAMALKDAALAKAEADRDAALAKVLTDAQIDAKVADRATLVAKAKTIAPEVNVDGLTDAAIRKAVVVAKLGDAMAAKSEAYIDVRFDVLADDAGADPVAAAMKSGTVINLSDMEKIHQARDKALSDAWKPQTKKEAL